MNAVNYCTTAMRLTIFRHDKQTSQQSSQVNDLSSSSSGYRVSFQRPVYNNMSFGWSAGDIAQAAKLIYNLIRALDTVDGAASNYREAVSFLHDLKRTLEPLQSFIAWQAYPTYGREIEEQVRHIKGPIEAFLAAAVKYEPSLGLRAKNGHHRHVFRKLQWHVVTSKKVLGLKSTIESHIRIIDTLLQRLTL